MHKENEAQPEPFAFTPVDWALLAVCFIVFLLISLIPACSIDVNAVYQGF